MAAFKSLIQLGSRLRAIHVGSTMNTPLLRRTSVNSYRFLSSSSSSSSGCGSECCRKQERGLELASLLREYTKLQYEIENMREKLENKDTVSHLKTELQVRDMSDETKKLISEAKKSVIKYSTSATRLVGAALEELLTVSPDEAAPPVSRVKGLLILASVLTIGLEGLLSWALSLAYLLIVSPLLVCAFFMLSFIEMTRS